MMPNNRQRKYYIVSQSGNPPAKKYNTTAISLKLLAQDKDHETGVTRAEIFRVNPDEVIFEENFNVRAKDDSLDAHIEQLYQSMKHGAYIPPVDLRVEAGKAIVIDGHCRVTAARRLKLEAPEYTLEARQFRGNEQDRVLHMLGTGSGQKPLTPLEAGIGYLRLIKFGLTSQQIAKKLGVSSVTVENGLILAEAPVEVQNLIKTGDVSSTTAREAIKQGPEGVKALLDAAAEANANPAPATKTRGASKKKKVTAKKLAGTAADKSVKTDAKKKKSKKGTSYTIKGVMENEIVVKIAIVDAQATVDFLKANAPEDNKEINALVATLELAMM